MALKAAETDATKRALATFGNPFGLALYDKDQARVTKPSGRRQRGAGFGKPAAGSDAGATRLPASLADQTAGPLVLRAAGTPEQSFDDPVGFVAATLMAIGRIASLDRLYAFWEANLDSLRHLRAPDPRRRRRSLRRHPHGAQSARAIAASGQRRLAIVTVASR